MQHSDKHSAAAVCRRFSVSGKVQGVFFRDSTRKQARHLGISGYAQNMRDGTVEVVACGTADRLDELLTWLHSGPPMAVVAAVRELPAGDDTYADFSIA